MNARRPDDDLERLLADDGGELGALYRRLPRAEPPRRLDRSVLGEATRAVHGSRPRGPRWLVGFGSAAGVVLAAGIAWHVGHEGLRESTTAPRNDNPAWVPVTPLDESAVHRAPPAPAAAETEASPANVPIEAAPAAAPPAAPPAPRLRKPASPAPAHDAMKAREPVASPPPPPASPAAAPATAASDTSAPSPAAAGTAQSMPSKAESAVTDAERATSAEGAASQRARRSGPSPSSSVELRRDTQLAPDAWLAHIRQLLRQGRRQQAIESLQLFRRAHPDWVLPQELQDLAD